MKDYCKHVLFIGPHYQLRGGMASVLKIYSDYIRDFNFLATYNKGSAYTNILYFSKAFIQFLWRILTDRQIKIVHIHAACRGSFARKAIILHTSRLFGKKTLLHLHGGEFKVYYNTSGRLKKWCILTTLKNADELGVLSDEWKIYFDELTGKKKSIVINNPVVVPDHVAANKETKPINVLYLNHITEKKGIFDIIEVLKRNKTAYTGVFKLHIAGQGAGLEKMKTQIAAAGLETLTEYRGWVTGQAKDELIQECSVFILPSYFEGLPMSILEVMAEGKPVIATNVGGIPRAVKPHKNGWLFTPGNIEELTQIFDEIKNDPAVLEDYGKKSSVLVQDFSIKKVVEDLNSIYQSLLEGSAITHKAALAEEVK